MLRTIVIAALAVGCAAAETSIPKTAVGGGARSL